MVRLATPFAFSGILALYLALSLYQLDLPGLHYDEAFEAVPAVQLLQHQPLTAFRNSSLVLNGQHYPLMTQDYIGALNTYAALPFIYLLGPTPVALRLFAVLVGACTLWLTYALTHRLTSSPLIGLIATLYLAVDPTFVFWNRQGIFVTAITATIGLGTTYCWLRRWQSGYIAWSITGAFLMGLGIYAKLIFLWLIVALVAATLLLNLPWLIAHRTKLLNAFALYKKEALFIGLAFLAGCWPLLIYNLQTGGTILSITKNAQTSYYGVNNYEFGANLIKRIGQFGTLLSGSHLWYLGGIESNPLPLFGFGLLLGGIIVITTITIRSKKSIPSPLKIALFPFIVISVVILLSIQTVSALWVTHFAILMPWPAIALAIAGWFLAMVFLPWSLNKKVGDNLQRALWAGLLLLITTNLIDTIRYHIRLTESGGLSGHSDAIYDLGRWLAQHPEGDRPVVAMDWGLAAPIIYLTHGQVSPVEVFGYAWQPDEKLTTRLDTFIKQPATLYLWRAPDEVIFDRSEEFKALYRPLNLVETIEEAFYERSGRPLLGITRLVTEGTAKNPP